ncbi:16S rRNA (uracil(1498)-N(3))-methyltransferase [Nitrosomonas sp. Nm51]|uniref:16S rRNA (uracil(1498)-N(3))-methyltransferase n=1 Tax=Nitrosomonas sp. Nm51 TaxID=133720 RepID=UPI000B82A982|nr:16S rRNA (uracil(1498)-N(3))-methyltransferase [Nitrosomonas sp. Nm51]
MPPRFFHAGDIHEGQTIKLASTVGHHATRVLRTKTGDSVILFNGKGGEFWGRIINDRKGLTTVIIDKFNAVERESLLTIELVQALCANEKMDLIIQKSVELGVTCIRPITTTRSVVRLTNERAMKRVRHWQRVIISACEQCGRNFIPTISPLISFIDWASQKKNCEPDHLNFMLSVTGSISPKNLPISQPPSRFTLIIGPEGGLTPEESAILQQAGFLSLRLGKRILRTETAALATIAALQMHWGDF